MHIRIFEGIATSGKSTVITGLEKRLAGRKLVIYTEEDTHIPIQGDRKELHMQFFSDLIDRAVKAGVEIALFDRLYMTQAFRAHASMADYAKLEGKLAAYDARTIFLEVDPKAIAGRLEKAMEHRDNSWAAYVHGKAESIERVATMYDAQQYAMRHFAAESLLKSLTFDTTTNQYDAIVAAVLAELPLL
ncbi:MAG TPA: hypothetical protein VLG92_00010 [Candidatus Saccharimonadia bacterium]|nr:hypothetical protein [Candidatus Saccharimonadia bacterium]